MPKAKTHSGASKRFRRTGTGKIVRQKANHRHLLEHKPSQPHPPARRPHRGVGQRHQARQEAAERLTAPLQRPRPTLNMNLNEIGIPPWHA